MTKIQQAKQEGLGLITVVFKSHEAQKRLTTRLYTCECGIVLKSDAQSVVQWCLRIKYLTHIQDHFVA